MTVSGLMQQVYKFPMMSIMANWKDNCYTAICGAKLIFFSNGNKKPD
jgi:hypothetical protein